MVPPSEHPLRLAELLEQRIGGFQAPPQGA
jgi:hypothetical protein